jgi:hypothetical protein
MAAAIVVGRYPGKIILTGICFAATNFPITGEMQDGRFGWRHRRHPCPSDLPKIDKIHLSSHAPALFTEALHNFKRKAFDFVHPRKICWDAERRTPPRHYQVCDFYKKDWSRVSR